MKPKAIDRVLWGDFDNGKQGKGISETKLLSKLLSQRLRCADSCQIAAALLVCFGSLGKVFRAPTARLTAVLGAHCVLPGDRGVGIPEHPGNACNRQRVISDAIEVIENTRSLLFAVTGHAVSSQPLLDNFEAVITHCRAHLAGERREQFHLLVLDAEYFLLAHECVQVGTINHVTVYPREVMAIALKHQASSLILVHNHPSGDATPSPADISMTRIIAQIGDTLGISVTDHIIVSSGSSFSFRKQGLLPLSNGSQPPGVLKPVCNGKAKAGYTGTSEGAPFS